MKYTPEQIRLIEVWGICPVCGAPRENLRTVETVNGHTTIRTALVCTKETSHSS